MPRGNVSRLLATAKSKESTTDAHAHQTHTGTLTNTHRHCHTGPQTLSALSALRPCLPCRPESPRPSAHLAHVASCVQTKSPFVRTSAQTHSATAGQGWPAMAFYIRACCPLISAPSLTDWHMGGWEHGEQAAWDRGQGGHLPAVLQPTSPRRCPVHPRSVGASSRTPCPQPSEALVSSATAR